MASDEQRRAIAAAIHAYARDDLHGMSFQKRLAQLCGVEGATWRQAMHAVADLIEPQADLCWDVSGYQDVFECSECSCKVELITVCGNEHGDTFSVPLMPSFCPNCGRGVVRASKR